MLLSLNMSKSVLGDFSVAAEDSSQNCMTCSSSNLYNDFVKKIFFSPVVYVEKFQIHRRVARIVQ